MSLFGGLSGVGPLGDIGSILGGGTKKSGEKLYGTKPVVPELQAETEKSIQASINLLPSLTRLAESYNTMSQEAMNKQLELAAPGYRDYVDQRTQVAKDLLSGKYPDTVQNAIEDQVNRTGAAWNFGHGTQTGSFGLGRIAFNRGQIPLQAFQTGLSTEQSWAALARSQVAPSLNTGAYLVSPGQQFQRDWQQSLITAAPDPVARGQFDTGMATLGMVLGIYSGGPGYQNTYRPNYGQSPYAQPANSYPSNTYNPNPSGYPDYNSTVAAFNGQPPPGTGSGVDAYGNPISTAPGHNGPFKFF